MRATYTLAYNEPVTAEHAWRRVAARMLREHAGFYGRRTGARTSPNGHPCGATVTWAGGTRSARWVTSAGNELTARWSPGDRSLLVTVSGHRHGIPWRFLDGQIVQCEGAGVPLAGFGADGLEARDRPPVDDDDAWSLALATAIAAADYAGLPTPVDGGQDNE